MDPLTAPATPIAAADDPYKESEFNQVYENEDHVCAFRDALEQATQEASAELISAVTDFIPVQQTPSAKRQRRRMKERQKYNGYTFTLMRVPLMIIIFSFIAVEMWMYISIRQIVNIWEYFVTWRGKRNRLRKDLRNATTYEEWTAAAQKLDTYLKKDEWKNDPDFGYYDYHLLARVNKSLRVNRESNRMDELKDNLLGVVKSNFGGVENARLYSQTYINTKKPIEDYVQETSLAIKAVTDSADLSDEEKRTFLKSIHKNFGRTALCLSGGAGFGYYHLGVVRALLNAGVLPSVIAGTSAGGLLAALVCCRTDDELKEVLVPELAAKFTACSDNIFTWLPRLIRKGARFDSEDWARKVQWITKGSLTFSEAYVRTGRILNISVVPFDPHSPPKLLNYLTTPDCVIWSAVIASAAIPGILNPVVLMRKRPDGSLVSFSYGGRGYKDGSLRADIPLQALHTHFNVNYTIVSQVNPHVHLFFYAARGSIGRPVSHLYGEGWRGGYFFASMEHFLKLDLSKWLKVLRDLELLPKFMNQDWSWIWLQKFDGHVTILPKSGISDWMHLLTDPDEGRLKHCLSVGEKQTFPKLHMISNRMKIEQAIENCRTKVKTRLDSTQNGRRQQFKGALQGMLSEDSENTMKARSKAFGSGYRQAIEKFQRQQMHQKNGEEGSLGGGTEGTDFGIGIGGRKQRATSWPGIRFPQAPVDYSGTENEDPFDLQSGADGEGSSRADGDEGYEDDRSLSDQALVPEDESLDGEQYDE